MKNKVKAIVLIVVVSVFCLISSVQATPSFINASFENYNDDADITQPFVDLYDYVTLEGWTTANSLGRLDVFSEPGYNASDGDTSLRLHPGLDQAIQEVSGFITGQQYSLTFDLARTGIWNDRSGDNDYWSNVAQGIQGVQVYTNGDSIGSITTDIAFDTSSIFGSEPFAFSTYSLFFTAAAPEIEFRFDLFNKNSLGGVALDNLQIDAVPEPSTIVLISLGLPLLALIKRKKIVS